MSKRKTARKKTAATEDVALFKVADQNGKFIYAGTGVPQDQAERLLKASWYGDHLVEVYTPEGS